MRSATERLQFVKDAFGPFVHDADYLNFSVVCPYCSDKKPTKKKKLVIHTGRWVAQCWVCGFRTRSIVPILRKVGRQDLIQEFVEQHGGKVYAEDVEEETEPVVVMPKGFRMLAVHQHDGDPQVNDAMRYLAMRGVTEGDLWRYKLGVADDPDMLDRIVMPSFDENGDLNYITARRTDDREWAKYYNSPVSRNARVFNALLIDWKQPVILVEGPFDLLKCPDNAIPMLGCGMNEESLLFNTILAHGTPVVLMLDPGAWRRQDWIAKRLVSYSIETRVVMGSVGDPGDRSKKENAGLVRDATVWSRESSMRSRIAAL